MNSKLFSQYVKSHSFELQNSEEYGVLGANFLVENQLLVALTYLSYIKPKIAKNHAFKKIYKTLMRLITQNT